MEQDKDILEILEKRLDNSLLPVSPEDKYINNLNTRLMTEPRISIERINTLRIILFLFLAFVTGFTFYLFMNEMFSRGRTQEQT